MTSIVRSVVPTSARHQFHKLRRLGPSKYVEYTRIELGQRLGQQPIAGQPFSIGAAVPIVLAPTTVPSVRVHWITYAHAVKEFRAFKRLAPRHNMFLDVGAAAGLFSAAFCAITSRQAWAFEPSPAQFARLQALIAANPQFDIRACDFALGQHAGEQAYLEYEDGQFSGADDGNSAGLMAMRTLDDFVDEHELAPDLAKIDVEGMELDVLRGGEKTIRASVKTLLLEVHYSALMHGETVHDVQRVVRDLGFKMFDLDLMPIADLQRYTEAEPEIIPGYTIIVCQK